MKHRKSLVFILTFFLLIFTSNNIVWGELTSPKYFTEVTEDGYVRSLESDKYNTSNYIETGWPDGYAYRGYIEWNISSIADNANITKVYFKFKAYNNFTGAEIRQMEIQPSTTSGTYPGDVIYLDAGNGTIYGNLGSRVEGEVVTIDLGSSAASDLEDQLDVDWFAIGTNNITAGDGARIYSSEGGYTPQLIVETDEGDYSYIFYGMHFENGTYYQEIVVIAYSSDSTDEFNVSGSQSVRFDEKPIMFSFPVEAYYRRIYPFNDNIFYIFYPDDDYTNYEFDVTDYTGKLGEGESYLESYRVVNGTSKLIERMKVSDVVNNVPLMLVTGQTYSLYIQFSDNSTYSFGYFIAGINPTPILSITDISFGDQAHTVYQYILAESSRPNATHIQMNYQDSTPNYHTTIVNFTVTYRNGTLAYNSSQSGLQTLTFNWYGADNETDYVVDLWAHHQYHGQIRQRWVLDYERSFLTFPDIDILGTWPFPSGNLFALMISVLVAGLFSFGSMTLAPFMFMTVLSSFNYIGAASFTYTQLAIGFALSIIFALAYRESHG